MQRRTKAILLIVFGLIVIIGVIVWLIWPWKTQLTSQPQPPEYVDSQVSPAPLLTEPTPAPVITDPALLESRRLEDRLRRFAQDFVSRAGSYSNADEFAALREAGLEATPEVRTFFAAERTRLTSAYGLRSGAWGQTTRGLASKITSPTPIRDQRLVTVQVDAQVITESGDASPVVSYRKADVNLQRTGDTWLVSKIEWTDT